MSNYQAVIDLVTSLTGQKVWATQVYINITNDPIIGMFLDRIVYWSDKGSREDGFFWKKADEWESEICLSYAQQKRAETALIKLGFIETKKHRVNNAPTMHYKPIMESIVNAINTKFKKVEIQESRNSENSNGEIQESSISEIQESRNSITYLQHIHNNGEADNGKEPSPPGDKKPKIDGVLKQQMVYALSQTCRINLRVASGKQKGLLGNSATGLIKIGVDPPKLKDFEQWWYSDDWRGQKGQPPNPEQVVDEWGRFESASEEKQKRDKPKATAK